MTLFHGEGVVALTAAQIGSGSPHSEFQSLHRGNAIDDLGDSAFHAAEHGLAQTCGQAGDPALHNAAYAVTLGSGLGDGLLHTLSGRRGQNGEVGGDGTQIGVQGVESVFVGDSGDFGDFSADTDAHFAEPLQAKTTGNAQGGCQPAGEMAAAGCVLEAAVFNLGGVIRVTWAGTVGQIGIVSGTGIGIVNDGGNGGAAGKAIQDSRQKFRTVFFFPGGGPIVPAGGPAIQKGL